jgi:uncharacterized protein YwqG
MDDRHKRAEDCLESAQKYLAEGNLEMAISHFGASVGWQDRADIRLQIAKLDCQLECPTAALRQIEAGLALFSPKEQNLTVYNDLKLLRDKIEPALKLRHEEIQEALLGNDFPSFVKVMGCSSTIEKAILENLKPSYRLYSKADSSDASKSKLGGIPDLPREFPWPRSANKVPLAFICQIDLSALPKSDFADFLPNTGLLSFFYESESSASADWGQVSSEWRGQMEEFKADPIAANKFIEEMKDPSFAAKHIANAQAHLREDYDPRSARVFHFASDSELVKPVPPSELPDESRFNPCQLTWEQELTFPDCFEALEFQKLSLSRGERYDLEEMRWWYGDHKKIAFGDLHAEPNGLNPMHRLLGHPQFLQMDFRLHLDQQTWDKAGSWRLLLQIDSDNAANMCWQDVGRIYFCMRQDDIQKHNFDSAIVVLQSS